MVLATGDFARAGVHADVSAAIGGQRTHRRAFAGPTLDARPLLAQAFASQAATSAQTVPVA